MCLCYTVDTAVHRYKSYCDQNCYILLIFEQSQGLIQLTIAMSASQSTQRFKIVLLGEGRVGKTSILLRYTKGEYTDRQVSTLQASYLDKKISISGQNTQLSIWDTAGQVSGSHLLS